MTDLDDFESRLEHVRSNAKPETVEKCLAAYRKMQGNPRIVNSINRLSSYYRASALLAWFDQEDLGEFRRLSWLSSMVKRASLQISGVSLGGFKIIDMMYCMMPNEKSISHWASQYLANDFFDIKKSGAACNDPSVWFFNWLQLKLALQGDWDALVARADFFLSNPPKTGVLYRIDSLFYKALAEGDTGKMEELLEELVSPKVNKIRGFEETFSFEQGIISPWGVMLSKVAWMHGHEVDIKTPSIPSEWLPNDPLPSYEMELEEFKGLDVFSSLEARDIPTLGDLSRWSPRPLGDTPLGYKEACGLAGVNEVNA